MGKFRKLYALGLACSMALGVAGLTMIQSKADMSVASTTITSKMQGDALVLLNGEVADFALNYTIGSAINYAPADGIATDRYIPKPATISWENSRDDALYYTLRVGLKQDLSDADSFIVSDTTANIDYLYSAKHYYYQVYAHYDNDEVVKSRVFDFYTADVPRTVYVEGVTNTRDIGGRYVLDGQYQVKQGMVYRGSEVDRELGAITEEGKRVMVHDLGIKTDLDIRGGDVQYPSNASPIDASLNYIHLEAPWYTGIFTASYKEDLTTEIRTFANPDNYPIFFHCSVGRDRAGTLSGLIGALLGVSFEDICRDYEMSFLSRVGLNDATQGEGKHLELMNYFKNTFEQIQAKYPAATLMDSVERFVEEYLGITQAEVDSIRNILLEEASYTVATESESKILPQKAQAAKSAAAAAETRDFPCEYSVSTKGQFGSTYGSSAVYTYTADEAAAKGVPAGYENQVVEVLPTASQATVGCGILLDFSKENIPLNMIKSLQFRVYIGAVAENAGTAYPQIRIADPNGTGEWVYQVNKANTTGEWTTVTIPYNSKFAMMCVDGMLAKFALSLRTKAQTLFYIDSILCELKPNDGNAPVINYTGESTIGLGLGKALDLNVTATDAQEGDMPVEYIWEDGVALNENGTPAQAGVYTLTLKSVDYYGNVATKVLTVNVVDADTKAPEIALNFTQVKAVVGTKPMLKVTATDNSGSCNVTTVWSDGALDMRGRLTVGQHTWTITATDSLKNTATKTVTFIVTESEPTYAITTDEATAFGNVTVTFDGENAITVPYGVAIDKPIDPVREADEAARYEFIGWFYGDKEWDFSSVVTSDINLQSKWKEYKQIYKVTFEGTGVTQGVEYGSVIPADLIPEAPEKKPTSRVEYVFTGWYLGETLWNMETDVVTGNITLTAQFVETARKYTVTFDGANAQEYGYGSTIEAPATPEKAPTDSVRYEFIGWFYGGKEWNFETDTITYHTNLQSQWKEISLEVETPDDSSTGDSTQTDNSSSADSSTNSGADKTESKGCFGGIDVAVSGMITLCAAAAVVLKKKED